MHLICLFLEGGLFKEKRVALNCRSFLHYCFLVWITAALFDAIQDLFRFCRSNAEKPMYYAFTCLFKMLIGHASTSGEQSLACNFGKSNLTNQIKHSSNQNKQAKYGTANRNQ